MARFEVYKESFKAIVELNSVLNAAAVKNKVSEGALTALLALNNGVDLSFLVKDEFIDELVKSGFIKIENNAVSITGKGAILAKSLERIL